MKNWKDIILSPTDNIREAMRTIDKGAIRTGLVCDTDLTLLGTVTDGDIRRWLLVDGDMGDPVSKAMNPKPRAGRANDSTQSLLQLMSEYALLALPVLDDQHRVAGVHTFNELSRPSPLENPVFIMAGGFGTRLRPLTDECPKPMLKVGDKPLLEHILQRCINQGFRRFFISTHYMPEQIHEHFGDGNRWGVSIQYIHEEAPLGTGGALGLLKAHGITDPVVMMNGDVLTKIDFREMLEQHDRKEADATMCTRELEHQVAFGVVECENDIITGMVEKPTYRYRINTGVYVVSPECLESVDKNQKIDMPTLLEERMKAGNTVGTYTSHAYWLDIGRMSDFQKAQTDIVSFYHS